LLQQKISVVILAVDVHADHHPAVVHLTERMKRVKLEDSMSETDVRDKFLRS
jgi:hypothetical protein